ncbi:hypothetical protein N9895_02230 [Gammaproteobacteria bacterium]|jgi:hypothetical protein|nr:hypothetical protein [Gammaproteobacteria bacterium]|tara:strand:- start:3476 stop:4081 length:606 start_codon:yes stop_codon:yes gene_type:complete
MGMQLNFSNMLQFFAAISPILLAFCLVMLSIFNSDIKGMVYLGGVLIASLINLFILNTLKVKSQTLIPPSCNLIDFPFNLNEYVSPAFNSMFIAFTLAYLYLPMQYISGINFPVLMFITGLLVLDGGTKIMGGCTTFSGVALGSLVGFVLGIIWFVLFYSTGHEDLLFFNVESSNNVICSRPKQQTFKCRLYKNGELIGEQ